MSQAARTISKGRALYDFAGNAEQRQLSFKAGDVINITSQFDNGWWAGELNGKVGYLPATYVQLITAAEQRGAPAPGAVPGGAGAARPNGAVAGARPTSAYASGAAPSPQSPGGARPPAPSAVARPGLTSGGSGIGGSAGGPPPPAAGSRPPLSSSASAAPSPRAVSGYAAPPPVAASRPPIGSSGGPPSTPQAAARPPVAAPPPAGRPPLSTPSAPVALKPTDRGRAATLRAAAAEASDVSDADIKELDQLLSKLQNDVIDLKKLM